MNNKTAKKELEENGVVFFPKLVSEEKCDAVLKNTFSLLSHYASVPEELNKMDKPWEHDLFHETMKKLREGDPELFGALYDSAQGSVSLDNLLTDESITKVAADLLGITVFSLSSSGHIQRMDQPKDARNLYGWHQERSYYPQNRDGRNGLAIWIPLIDVPLNGGALVVAKGSHKAGYLKQDPKQESELHSTQHTVPDEIVKKYDEVLLPTKKGDAIITYMTTMHKSSVNKTSRFRFNVIGRYHNAIAPDFVPYRYTYTHNKRIKDDLKEKGLDVSDLD